jgi:hypothetical protein
VDYSGHPALRPSGQPLVVQNCSCNLTSDILSCAFQVDLAVVPNCSMQFGVEPPSAAQIH